MLPLFAGFDWRHRTALMYFFLLEFERVLLRDVVNICPRLDKDCSSIPFLTLDCCIQAASILSTILVKVGLQLCHAMIVEFVGSRS
jgi:hypothetical protein